MCLGSPDIPKPQVPKVAELPAQRVPREAPQRVDPEVIRRRMSRESQARDIARCSSAANMSDRPGVLETTVLGLKEDV